MSQALVVQKQGALVFTQEDITILRNTKFKNFTDGEIQHASKICALLNLTPFLNQIHFVKRKNKDGTYSVQAQIGIDGFRLTAQRSGGYAGSDEPVYEYDEQSQGKKYPAKATVTVYKIVQGIRCPFTASARWDEYYPGDGPNGAMWQKMPHNQLAKCAEALAHRKACPAELSTIYVDAEMHQAENDRHPVAPEQPGPEDGIQSQSYCVPYGPMARKPIEECDPAKLKEYIEGIELKAKTSKKPIPVWAERLIAEASPLIADWERQMARQFEPGSAG